ncbi:MAG: PIN domain-containing protein [Chloroflexi bacterium]|nr:MAG: PIN domain-containing protein [Chloroflexota bacterium]
MTALVDTGFLLAVVSVNDRGHHACSQTLEIEQDPIVPAAIFTELAYMVIRDMGHAAFIRLMRSIFDGEMRLVFSSIEDLQRATDIMEQYVDSKIDFVDCVIVAMAERLNISRILTVDQRGFRILRPKHVPNFEILP